MENSKTIPEFLNYLNFEKRFSEHTANCYGADLRQFTEFLIDRSESVPQTTKHDQPVTSLTKS